MVVKRVVRALQNRLCTQRSISLSEDTVYALLSAKRRREVIRHIHYDISAGEAMDVGDAAVYVAAVENDKHPDEVTSKEREAAYVGLYQDHLPKLDDAGVVKWDRRAGTIERGDDLGALAQLLGDVENATAAASSAARYPTLTTDRTDRPASTGSVA